MFSEHEEDVLNPFKQNLIISKICIVPALICCITTAILLIVIILKHLGALYKLYLSVAFYAATCVCFVAMVAITMLLDSVSVVFL